MNPEFERNIWLEASPRRVAWAGVALALIFGVVILITSDHGGMPQALGFTGTAVFVLCAVFWGARAAGTAVLSEVSDRTWDFQRLSAITPWDMTWGKLFGATSLAWLCALVGLLFSIGAAAVNRVEDSGWSLIFLIATAILVQAALLAASLIGVRKARAEGRLARSGGVVWGLIFGGFLLSAIAGRLGMHGGLGLLGTGQMFSPPAIVDWWGLQIQGSVFRALAVAAFAGWALAGAWRLMRLELQMRNRPLVWPGFLLFLALFSGGLFFQAGLAAALVTGALSAALCAYAAAFAEPADRVKLRQFLASARRGDTARAAPLAPLTLAPVILAVLLMLAAVAAGRPQLEDRFTVSAMQGLAIVAFMLRDLGVIAFFRFGPRPHRGDFGAVIALILLYMVGSIVGGTMGGPHGTALFAPTTADPLLSFGSGLVQVAIAWWLAARRIRAPEGQLSAPAPSSPASAPGS